MANIGSFTGPAMPSGASTTGSKVVALQVAFGSIAVTAIVPSFAVLRLSSGQVAVASSSGSPGSARIATR